MWPSPSQSRPSFEHVFGLLLSRQLLVTFARSKLDILVFGLGLSSGDILISPSWRFRKSRFGGPLLRGARGSSECEESARPCIICLNADRSGLTVPGRTACASCHNDGKRCDRASPMTMRAITV
ncbi:hypothetical protein NEUTE1DRAFT_139381 [Neurospora tetrasperma FGSC 2508]|uniref:Uncharacterized protein n=1 Tax=Neurospora tetrasperma (strain FGSC 2508 / ATCC MYA-4615 / P0657) TaxID=510951 RepID=F8MSM4_NEUT8|nr:uncharacterized protein NEUTE1DRAFT_139381 [Neurospora tetrasperma FGSC 2508]EGO55111.1 hypothetical protein NEUTE1DRAFT_139381 [Neurospora tetrasperma FGSC 2508]EGZ69679.1 hypothetical protein NEUTE2DRAFT_169273 [Neurospora tetrasperma FGSC 2509]